MRKLLWLTAALMLSACSSAPKVQQHDQSLYQLMALATMAYNEARLDSAETLYLQVLQRNPEYGEASFKLGNIYSRQGRLDAAVIRYQEALTNDSADGRVWHNLALVRVKQAISTLEMSEQYIGRESPYFQYLLQLQLQLNKLSSERHDDTER